LANLFYDVNLNSSSDEVISIDMDIAEQNPILITIIVLNEDENVSVNSNDIKESVIYNIIYILPEKFKEDVKNLFFT